MRMLAQLAVNTNAHPYQTQLVSFFLSIAPVVAIVALIVFVQIWRVYRNRRHRSSKL